MTNHETVTNIYAAFQRGDVPAILERVAENVDWNNSGVASSECPWNGDFSGRTRLPGFFKAIAENLDFQVFESRAHAASGDSVSVQLRIEGTVKRTGRGWKNDVVHFWIFNSAGLVVKYRHFNDTAAELAAWRG